MSETLTRKEGEGTPEASAPSLTKRDLNRSFWRFFWSFQISWNYERMQALGFAYAIDPVLRRLNPDRAGYAEALQRHLQFFNSAPIVGAPMILGSTIALEEAGEKTPAAGVKVAMMGPLAGVGDTLTWALYNSIVFTLGASFALRGEWIGPVLAGLLIMIPYFLVRRWQFTWSYRQGRKLAAELASGVIARISEGATVLGLIVLGGFIPSIVKVQTSLTYKQTIDVGGKDVAQKIGVQEQLDAILPFLLPVAVTAGAYCLLKRFGLNPVWVIAIIAAVGIGLGWAGWFVPEVAAK
jgi:mannose/fructose/N-acetylgalactosamine-specific phosphotransferase system component IID